MSGVKGQQGGGGYRKGTGPKRKPPIPFDSRDPVEFLLDVMQGTIDASPTQVQAAIAAARFKGGDGKKARKQDEAEAVASESKFGARGAPLKLVNV